MVKLSKIFKNSESRFQILAFVKHIKMIKLNKIYILVEYKIQIKYILNCEVQEETLAFPTTVVHLLFSPAYDCSTGYITLVFPVKINIFEIPSLRNFHS